MSIRTLHVTNAWHPQSGGIRTFYLALLEAANAAQHEMHLVVPGTEDAAERFGQWGWIHHIKAPLAPGSNTYRIIYPHEFLHTNGRLSRILRQQRPHLVEICDKYTLNYLGGLLRVGLVPGIDYRPVVVALSCERFTESITNYWSTARPWQWLATQYLRWLYFPLADHHIAVSGFVAEELQTVSDCHKVDRSVWLGPMGVDYAAFAQPVTSSNRTPLLAHLQTRDPVTVLLYAGRLAREKNIPLLLQALRILAQNDPRHEYRLALAGEGDQRAALESMAARLAPGQVHFLGHQSKQALIGLLHSCDIFVHPNPREPFGIGPLEAMAAGLPLVAPDSGGVNAYASEHNAWLAQPTPAAFAEAIRGVVKQPELAAAKATLARDTAAANDWSRAAGHFHTLYRTIYSIPNCVSTAAPLAPLFTSTRSGK
jgi:glycosyltransferase involved in cell wall biosynthesis